MNQNALYSEKAEFKVLSDDSQTAPLAVIVEGPNGEIPAEVMKLEDNGYEVSFIPTEVGEHNVDVRIGETPVVGSPFTVMVGDPKRVVITERGTSHFCHNVQRDVLCLILTVIWF